MSNGHRTCTRTHGQVMVRWRASNKRLDGFVLLSPSRQVTSSSTYGNTGGMCGRPTCPTQHYFLLIGELSMVDVCLPVAVTVAPRQKPWRARRCGFFFRKRDWITNEASIHFLHISCRW
jgi:hypothetical protein